MFKKISKMGTALAISTVTMYAAVAPQTVKDSMSGNWLVVNGQKRFMSGMNLAWINFATDVGDKSMDINSFTDKVKQIRKAGGNALRWWLHTDASNCPKIDSDGKVTGLGVNTIKNLRNALDTAYAYGVVVDMCLFSFDLLVPGTKSTYSSFNLENNYKFLTDTSAITTYLEKGLKPILDSVGDHPAVMCWEVFNEPEGMLASAGWSHVTKKISQTDILRITNRIAGFVHRNSKKMVSTGIASFQYCSQYSTEKLIAAGGDTDGYLDFYMAHYYPEWQDESISPFHHPASFWNMDKPILIGEFPANDWSSSTTGPSSGQPLKTSMKSVDAFAYAYENGYAGAMSWAMTEQNSFFGTYETTAPALKALFDAHKNDIMIKDVTITELQGDLCMKLALDLPPATYPEAEYNGSFNFTGVDSLMIDLFIPSGTSTNLVFKLVLKSTNDWIWCPSSISFTPKTTGTWVTYAVPVSSFESSVEGKTINLADIRQIVLQFYTSGTTTFKGSIYVDNARYKKGTTVTVISDFNKTGTAWSEYESGTDDNLQISISEKPAASPVKFLRPGNNPVVFRKVSLTGKKLVIGKGLEAISQVRIYDITGKVLASSVLPVSGCMIDCSNLSKGNYLVGINEGGRIQVTSIVLQ